MESNLQKAIFEIYENESAATAKEKIQVLFNPSEYSISGGADYESEKDHSGTSNQDQGKKDNYKGSRKQTLSLELFFDTNMRKTLGSNGSIKMQEASDVSKITKKFVEMTRSIGTSHMPPVIAFKWGSINFRGRVDDIKTTYLMFTKEGKPVRAKMSLTIKEAPKPSEKFMEPFESPDRTKARMVTDAVSVWNIAQAEYGDPDMWRVICKANDIADPMKIPSGTILRVPALD